MAYLVITINCPSESVNTMTGRLKGGDSTKPHEIVNAIVNELQGINGGNTAGATITATSSTAAPTVSGTSGGVTVTLNLT